MISGSPWLKLPAVASRRRPNREKERIRLLSTMNWTAIAVYTPVLAYVAGTEQK